MPVPPKFDPRYRLLDACRGFACVIVAGHHSGFVIQRFEAQVGATFSTPRWVVAELYRRMDLGVPLFFVISGYCIAASMDAHRSKGASPWRFLGRRIWRIYPPYWAAVVGFVAIVEALNQVGWRPMSVGTHSLHLDPPGDLSWSQWWGNLTLTETWRPQILGGDGTKNLTRISWTLCFEEQFYLVGFALLLIFPRRLFEALGVASVFILAWALAAFDAGWLYRIDGLFPRLWYQFAVGLLVYWRLVVAESIPARRSVEVGLAVLAVVGWINGSESMIVVALFGLALIALRPFDATLASSPILGPLRGCGRRCYSIYLIHLPVCVVAAEAMVQLGCTGFWPRALLAAPLATVAGVGAGRLFFALVESKFWSPLAKGSLATEGTRIIPNSEIHCGSQGAGHKH